MENTLFTFGIFYVLYGIAGILGFQFIPSKYRGHSWSRDYKRCRGISWLMLGLPWLVLAMVEAYVYPDARMPAGLFAAVLVAISLPSVIYAFRMEGKFQGLLDRETENE